VMVAVCGTRVPDDVDVLDVVLGDELEVVVRAVVGVVEVDDVVVVEELEGEGLLEQAASARAQAGRINNRIDHVRNALSMARVYDRTVPKWGFPREISAVSSAYLDSNCSSFSNSVRFAMAMPRYESQVLQNFIVVALVTQGMREPPQPQSP